MYVGKSGHRLDGEVESLLTGQRTDGDHDRDVTQAEGRFGGELLLRRGNREASGLDAAWNDMKFGARHGKAVMEIVPGAVPQSYDAVRAPE